MTIKVGDEVHVLRPPGVWSNGTYTVLYVQDCDPHHKGISTRKWAVVAYKSDTPQVFKLSDVKKVPTVKVVTRDGVMVADGSIILNHGVLYPELHTAVTVHCTEVDGVVDLTYPYTVEKK